MQSSITCTNCWRTSFHPRDIENGFCGYCNQFFPDGIVCCDMPEVDQVLYGARTRLVHVWGNRDIAAVVRPPTSNTIRVLNGERVTHADIDAYRNVLKVACDELDRFRNFVNRPPDPPEEYCPYLVDQARPGARFGPHFDGGAQGSTTTRRA